MFDVAAAWKIGAIALLMPAVAAANFPFEIGNLTALLLKRIVNSSRSPFLLFAMFF